MAPLLLPKSPFAATLYTPPAGVPPSQTARTHAHTSSVEPDAPNADAPAEQPTQDTPLPQTTKPKKRKRNDAEKPHILHQCTFRKPTWSYFHLSLITPGTASLPASTSSSKSTSTITKAATKTTTPSTSTSTSHPSSPAPASKHTSTPTLSTAPPSTNISPLTALPLLTQSLQSYLGITGSAIPIDILKTAGHDVFVRVPRQDARGLRVSLSGWIGSCDVENVPGVGDEGGGVAVGRVKVAWRVVGEGTVLGGLVAGGGGDGGEMFR